MMMGFQHRRRAFEILANQRKEIQASCFQRYKKRKSFFLHWLNPFFYRANTNTKKHDDEDRHAFLLISDAF